MWKPASQAAADAPCTMVLPGCRFLPIRKTPMSAPSLRRRLIAGFGANTFSRLSTTLTQIFSVPVFLSHWGVHLYGEWILLNTIPSYLGLSDVGFGSVAGNEMTMLAAAQDFDQALVVFQSVWVLTTVITSLLGLLLISAVWFLPLGTWLHMHAISAQDAKLIILLLGLAVLLGNFAGNPVPGGISLCREISAGDHGQEPGGAVSLPEHHGRSWAGPVSGPRHCCVCCGQCLGRSRSLDVAEARSAVDSLRHPVCAMGSHPPPHRPGALLHELSPGQRAEPAGDPGGDRLCDGSHRGGDLQYCANRFHAALSRG